MIRLLVLEKTSRLTFSGSYISSRPGKDILMVNHFARKVVFYVSTAAVSSRLVT
jgi:hypothetical protein